MKKEKDVFKIAAAQATPVFLNKAATTEKACALIEAAANEGARLIVFPESFVPAYPDWVWLIPAGKKALINNLFHQLLNNSVSVPDETTDAICAAAKKFEIYVTIGISEKNAQASQGSLFNSLLFIDDKGRIIGKHRKLVPTGGERLMWAPGDGSTLQTYDTAMGKIGGLICWENYMPLARYALYAMGAQLYVAPTWDQSEIWMSTMRHIAKEGSMFVISCCMPFRLSDIPDDYEFKLLYAGKNDWINRGGSCIVTPNGNFIREPVFEKEELIFADIDMALISSGKWILDTAGHYARPDVFHFSVNRAPHSIMKEHHEV